MGTRCQLQMKNKRIYIAGHKGMVGSAIIRRLKESGCENLVLKSHAELDLTEQKAVREFFEAESIDIVILAAAKVGGIHANNEYPAQFIYENLMMECNVINSACQAGVNKLLFLGSSCIYPKLATQPMKESELLTGTLEPTNEPYAIAKIAGIKLCESYNRQHGVDYRSIMPTNLYGPNDNFHAENSHVIPALISRFHQAKKENRGSIEIWGSGTPKREFLHVDDMAEASLYIMGLDEKVYLESTEPMLSHINVGSGFDVSIRELAETIADITSFKGEILFDTRKPDGAPRKLMNVSRLEAMGWKASIPLREGLSSTYKWYVENYKTSEIRQ